MTNLEPREVARLLDQAERLGQQEAVTHEMRIVVLSTSLRSLLAALDAIILDLATLPPEVLDALGYTPEIIEGLRNGHVVNLAALEAFGSVG